jgi:hypothetical protein
MNLHPILIRNIKHLTDARYFAAMGVDWMSMALTDDPQSFAMWHTLADWIEGVKLAAELDVDDEMLLAKAIIDAKPQGIVSSQNIAETIPSTTQLFLEVDSLNDVIESPFVFCIKTYDPNLLQEYVPDTNHERVFLFSDWTKESLEEVIAKGFKGGICFSGGEEQATGMRDYELMDDLLDLLR